MVEWSTALFSQHRARKTVKWDPRGPGRTFRRAWAPSREFFSSFSTSEPHYKKYRNWKLSQNCLKQYFQTNSERQSHYCTVSVVTLVTKWACVLGRGHTDVETTCLFFETVPFTFPLSEKVQFERKIKNITCWEASLCQPRSVGISPQHKTTTNLFGLAVSAHLVDTAGHGHEGKLLEETSRHVCRVNIRNSKTCWKLFCVENRQNILVPDMVKWSSVTVVSGLYKVLKTSPDCLVHFPVLCLVKYWTF